MVIKNLEGERASLVGHLIIVSLEEISVGAGTCSAVVVSVSVVLTTVACLMAKGVVDGGQQGGKCSFHGSQSLWI